MTIYYTIIFFIFGLVFGSFYNVVGFRLCKGESLTKPRSHCQNCMHELKWYELIPVFSYIFLRGRCKCCKQKISLFYPLMETFSGILFAVSFYSFGFSYDLLLALFLSSMFIIIMVTDLNYYIIPDEVNLVFGMLILIVSFLKYGFTGGLLHLLYGFLMFVAMYLLMLLGNFLFKEESLGGGDIKLMFVLGMIFSLPLDFISLTLGAMLALPISCYFYFFHKDKVLPFGPFLVAGFLIIFFLKLDLSFFLELFAL